MIRTNPRKVATALLLVAVGMGWAVGAERSEVPEDKAVRHRAVNFIVTARTREVAEQVGHEAEWYRRKLARLWLGKELPDWTEPCPLRVKVSAKGKGGASTFGFDQGKVLHREMRLEGTLDAISADVLPHEIMHTILADWLRRPVPRWADEGVAMLNESSGSQSIFRRQFRQALVEGRGIPLRKHLVLKRYPSDLEAFYSQSHSLVEFLVRRKNRATLLQLITQGEQDDWDQAVKDLYGFATIEDLERAWLAEVRKHAPARAARGAEKTAEAGKEATSLPITQPGLMPLAK
jgi:hypothetical protein